MEIYYIAKKTFTILSCFIIATLIITYSTLFFMRTLETSITNPMTYAYTNTKNCELSIMEEALLEAKIQKCCNYMNQEEKNCSIGELKDLANSIQKNRTIENTVFLTDIVFLSYQNTIQKDQCIIDNFRGNDIYGGREYYQYPYLKIPRVTIITPKKQTLSTSISIKLDNSILSAINLILIHNALYIKNTFRECTLEQDACDQKYLDIYSILQESTQELRTSELDRENITLQPVSPIPDDDERYFLFNNYLYASEENNVWTNPVSLMSHTTISSLSYAFDLQNREDIQSKLNNSDMAHSESIDPQIIAGTEMIKELAINMAITTVKSSLITGYTDKISTDTVQIIKKYRPCMNDINCTKEVFQSHEYQNCTDQCNKENQKNIITENRDCETDCKNDDCKEDCIIPVQESGQAEEIYSSCVKKCYYGENNG